MIGNHEAIQWGIIGCGDVTEKKSGPAFNKVPHSKLVAVMRRNAVKAADYAMRHGVPRWYDDAHALIADPEVNAIYIATPPDSHLMYTRMALEAGKPVYVEKPMVLNSSEAMEMQQLADQHENRIVVAHYRRCWPQFQKVKQLLEEGAIGKPMKVHLVCTRKPLTEEDMQRPGVQWRINPAVSGGGLFHDLAPHQLDLLLYWFGDVAKVKGHAFNHGRIYEADDVVVGSLHFENGIQGFGYWNFAVPAHLQEDDCFIEGEKGWIRCSPFWHHKIECEREAVLQQFEFTPPEHNQIFLIEKAVEFFRGRGVNPCSAREAFTTIQWMDKLTFGHEI
jgi:predicted dehydrogenase